MLNNKDVVYATLHTSLFVPGVRGGTVGPTLDASAVGSKVKGMKLVEGFLAINTTAGEILTPLTNVVSVKLTEARALNVVP